MLYSCRGSVLVGAGRVVDHNPTHSLWLVWVRSAVRSLRGVVGLREWADVSLLFVCLRWFPTLVPAFVCLPDYRVS